MGIAIPAISRCRSASEGDGGGDGGHALSDDLRDGERNQEFKQTKGLVAGSLMQLILCGEKDGRKAMGTAWCIDHLPRAGLPSSGLDLQQTTR